MGFLERFRGQSRSKEEADAASQSRQTTEKENVSGFTVGQEVEVELPGFYGNKGDDILPDKWEVAGPAQSKKEQGASLSIKKTYPDGHFDFVDIPLDQLSPKLEKKETAPPAAGRAEQREKSVMYGFEAGERILIRDSSHGGDYYKMKEGKVVGPAKQSNYLNINQEFGARKANIEIPLGDIVKLDSSEARVLERMGLKDLQYLKHTLERFRELEERKKEIEGRKHLDKAFEDAWHELVKTKTELQTAISDADFTSKIINDLLYKLSGAGGGIGKIGDMLDNIEENYHSDVEARIQ